MYSGSAQGVVERVINVRYYYYYYKSQHIKMTLEKKILLPHLPEFELATFRSRVRCSIQAPNTSPPYKLSRPPIHTAGIDTHRSIKPWPDQF